jgi:hypothetical protein
LHFHVDQIAVEDQITCLDEISDVVKGINMSMIMVFWITYHFRKSQKCLKSEILPGTPKNSTPDLTNTLLAQ